MSENDENKNKSNLAIIVVGLFLVISLVTMILAWYFGALYLTEKINRNVEEEYYGSCTGAVRNINFEPISNATVTFYLKDENVITGVVTTDKNGEFNVDELPVGKYYIIASKKGYKSVTLSAIKISVSSTACVYFNLETE